ncbi:MAG: hypothetical protein ACE5K2_00150, partial [Candidatus Zixiibacteriota bacterium]
MYYRRIAVSLVFLISVIILASAQAFAEPVLIKLTLKKSSDYEKAISLGAVAYQRFDNSFLAELESEKLERLDKLDLSYQIIDEDPWSESYFLVSPVEGIAEVNLELYGTILLEEPEWMLIKTS